jgi:hypothetical protein
MEVKAIFNMKIPKMVRTIALQSLKRYWVMILFGFLILGLSSVSAVTYKECYQETANGSNINDGSCGLNYNGRYVFMNITDYVGNVYTNYSKPITANQVLWQVKHGKDGQSTSYNISIYDSCFNYNKAYLQLRFITGGPAGAGTYSYGQCLNSTGWVNITTVYTSVGGGGTATDNSYSQIIDGDWSTGASWDVGNSRWAGISISTQNSGQIYEEAMIWNISSFIENNKTYNPTTFETSQEQYILNFSTLPIVSASANLIYNGTIYASNVTCDGQNCLATNTINLPILTSQQNYSFYWILTLFNGSDSEIINSSFSNQTVNPIALTYCTSGTRVLNFTLYDEQNRTKLNGFNFDGTFTYSTGNSSSFKTLIVSNVSVNEINLCTSVNITYYINAIIAYKQGPYATRNWFYQNYPVTNITTNVSMYLLVPASSTSFILQVQDKNLQAVPNVLIEAKRCYPGTNTKEAVFIHRTDTNGLTTGNLEAETALYSWLITNNSQTLLSIDQCSKAAPQTTPYTLTFQLGGGYVSPWTNIDNATGITSTIVFNKTNNVLTWTYIDTSGNFNLANLTIISLNGSGNSQPIVCSGTNNLTSGIISCNFSAAGTYSAGAFIQRTGQTIFDQVVFTVETFSSTAGYYGVFLGFFLILISSFAFKFNEIAGIWSVTVTVVATNIIGLIAWGIPGVTAIVCLAIIITAVLER